MEKFCSQSPRSETVNLFNPIQLLTSSSGCQSFPAANGSANGQLADIPAPNGRTFQLGYSNIYDGSDSNLTLAEQLYLALRPSPK